MKFTKKQQRKVVFGLNLQRFYGEFANDLYNLRPEMIQKIAPWLHKGLGANPTTHPCTCAGPQSLYMIILPLLEFFSKHPLQYFWENHTDGLLVSYAENPPSVEDLKDLIDAEGNLETPISLICESVLQIHGLTFYCNTGRSNKFRLFMDVTIHTQNLDASTRHKWDIDLPEPTTLDKLRNRKPMLNADMNRIINDPHYHEGARTPLGFIYNLMSVGGHAFRKASSSELKDLREVSIE